MTTSTRRPDDRAQPIRGPGELVQAIPYLIGYHPAESLVLVGLQKARLVVTARVDLADLDVDAGGPGGLLEHTVRRAVDGGARDFVVIVYREAVDHRRLPAAVVTTAPDARRDRGDAGVLTALPGAELAHAARTVLARSGGRLLDALLVCSGRGWSYLCAGPADGWDLGCAPSPFVAEATVAGAAPRADRAMVAASLRPCSPEQRAELKLPLADAEDAELSAVRGEGRQRRERAARRALLAAARASDQLGWSPPDDTELARLAVALTCIETRDEVWLAIESRRLDARPLMLELARRCPTPYDVAPFFLYGWASWRAGNSMLAGVAARHALAGDPRYGAATMLADAVDHGLDPHRVPQLRRPRRPR